MGSVPMALREVSAAAGLPAMNDEVVEAVVKALAVAEEHAGAVAQDKPPHGEATNGSCICCCVVCESAVQAVARAALGAEPVARLVEALRRVEWQGEAGHWDDAGCPECMVSSQFGHADDCALAAALEGNYPRTVEHSANLDPHCERGAGGA